MRFKNSMNKITETLEGYVKQIDELEKQYIAEIQRQKQEIENMKGTYTEEYINKYRNNPKFYKNYKVEMQQLRSKAEPVVSHYLEMIEKQINSFFNAPVSPEFANKINSIAITGLMLSDMEFEILQDSANSYMERRLLNQLAESRTRNEKKVALNADTLQAEYKDVKASNPYLHLELPNIEEVFKAFTDYKQKANFLVNSYSGKNATLYMYLDNGMAQYISISADSYFRNKAVDVFSSAMGKANSILPESKIKRELTEQDKKFIDAIIDPKYPYAAKETVKSIVEYDPNIAELLRLDERYRDLVAEEE